MKIMHSHTDTAGSQTTIVSVQDDRVALATNFHDEDLILTDPDSFSEFDADAAEALAYGILHASNTRGLGIYGAGTPSGASG